MQCWIVMALWSAAAGCAAVLRGTALSFGKNPNELSCTDFKGAFLLGNHQYTPAD
jgi:hypothetical protein